MHAKIPADTYPIRPSGFATFFGSIRGSSDRLQPKGQVPIWVTRTATATGGSATQLIVRVRPEIEVVIKGTGSEEETWQETDAAMRNRLTLPSWPVRNWWVSHIVYVAQPPKRTRTKKPKKRRRNWDERFCYGSVEVKRGTFYSLGFVAIPRLKVSLTPSMDRLGKGVDIEFAVDRSKRRKQEVVRFVSELTKLERAESRLVHTGLGHLFGESYVEAMSEATQRISLVTSDSATRSNKPATSTESTEASQPGFERELRARATAKVEGFLSPDWLDPPTSESDRRWRIIFLGFTRCQMSSAYVLDKISESLPPQFEHFLPKSQPVSPHPYLDCQLIPNEKQGTVEFREFLSALEIYDPSHLE